MVSVICPSCKKEVTAKSNIRLAFRYHLYSGHNTTGQEEQDGIIKEAMAHIRELQKYEHRKARIAKGIPKGLRLLLERNHDYHYVKGEIAKCCDAHPECRYQKECRRRYDIQCNDWPMIGEDVESPTKEQPPLSIVVVIPSVSPEKLLEALERQLPMRFTTPRRV